MQIHCQICWTHVEGSRIRKEKGADSKIFGYKWMGPKCQFENMLQVHMMPGKKANKRRNL